MEVHFDVKGSYSKTEHWLDKLAKFKSPKGLEALGRKGVAALASATPARSGITSKSWDYRIERKGSTTSIIWYNKNIVNGVPIAIILQYGHGTGTGGYVQGRDYINPAIKPVFDEIDSIVRKAMMDG